MQHKEHTSNNNKRENNNYNNKENNNNKHNKRASHVFYIYIELFYNKLVLCFRFFVPLYTYIYLCSS